MLKIQEPKYDAVAFSDSGRVGGGTPLSYRTQIVNRESGQAIPDDEPVFILRARDVHALAVIAEYHRLIWKGPQSHRALVYQRFLDFDQFRVNHPERMKEPD